MYCYSPTSNSDSSDNADVDHHGSLPGIYALMMSRGIIIDKSQMSIFPAQVIKVETEVSSPNPIKKRKEGKRTLFTDNQRSILMHWLKNHQSNPYPTSSEKQDLMDKTGLNREQINVWFTNNRVRHGMSCTGQHHGKSSHTHSFKSSHL